MVKIKFQNSSIMISCEFARVSNHVIHLIGVSTTNTSGFIAYDEDGQTVLGNYSGYKTVYRVLSNGVQYSNDGSVYHPVTETLNFVADITETETDPFVDEVTVSLINFSGELQEITLTRANNWTYTLANVDVEEHWSINSAEDVEGFNCTIYDRTTVKYIWKEPTWAEIMEAQITYTALMTDTLIGEE